MRAKTIRLDVAAVGCFGFDLIGQHGENLVVARLVDRWRRIRAAGERLGTVRVDLVEHVLFKFVVHVFSPADRSKKVELIGYDIG